MILAQVLQAMEQGESILVPVDKETDFKRLQILNGAKAAQKGIKIQQKAIHLINDCFLMIKKVK